MTSTYRQALPGGPGRIGSEGPHDAAPHPRATHPRWTMARLRPLSDTAEFRFPPGMLWGGNVWRRQWGLFRVWFADRTVIVEKLGRRGLPPDWVDRATPVRLTRLDVTWSESMATKYIKAAMGRQSKKKAEAYQGDAVICEGRPALTEFMCEPEGPDGKPRELSVLMISQTADGVRVGLKDEDCGGWCWRTGPSLNAALDAVEKALQGEANAFRGPRPTRGQKKR